MTELKQDNVKGMFLGAFIGDAMGMPVETFTKDQILERYGRITKLHRPDGHKWFNGQPAGIYTDDTQLTLATARAMIDAKDLFEGMRINPIMDRMAEEHKAEYVKDHSTWGRSTKGAIRRLQNGVHWSICSDSNEWSGVGNGVAMKLSPLAVVWAKDTLRSDRDRDFATMQWSQAFLVLLENYTKMTHRHPIAMQSSMAHATAMVYCLLHAPETFNFDNFLMFVEAAARTVSMDPDESSIANRIRGIHERWEELDYEGIREACDGGGCYCYESVPMAHAFFAKGYKSRIECLYDVVSAGGDTDSTGSMVGSMLGALYGASIFPEHLVDALDDAQREEVLSTADAFCDTYLDG